jgi:hypothetical protein
MATAGIGAAGTPEFSILPVTICTSPMAYLTGDIRRCGVVRPLRSSSLGVSFLA